MRDAEPSRTANRTVGLALCLVLSAMASAYGDGGFLPPIDYSGRDLAEPCQRAVVIHAGDSEKLFLFVDYQGDAQHFAWIIPCPAMPEVRMTSEDVLEEVAKYYHHLELRAWEERMANLRGSETMMIMGGGPPSMEAVTVHSNRVLGPYEMAIVSADQGDALALWLQQNGYAIPKHAAPILQQYVEAGWFFVAAKVRTDPKDLQTLPPVRVEFKTPVPVYPLRISAIGSGVVDIRVYLFRAVDARPRQSGPFYALDKEFQTLCPTLAKEVPEIGLQDMEVARVVDSLVPQVMCRLDDLLHAGSFYRHRAFAMHAGIAEALMSSNRAESAWAEGKLGRGYYMGRWSAMPDEHATLLREVGKRLGTPLRDKLLGRIEAEVQAAQAKAVQAKGTRFQRENWVAYLEMEDGSLEGAVDLLVKACEPDDPTVLATLEKVASAAGGGTCWGDALTDLATPASRRALFRIGDAKSDGGAVFRFVHSLEENHIDEQERRIAMRELLTLLSKGAAKGDARTRSVTLLKTYADRDFGLDWERWEVWLDQNAADAKR